MRQQLDIYASVVLCKSLPGFPTRHDNVDFAIIRENTEGEYSGLEHQSFPGVVESLKVSTRAKAERISRFAFDFALKNNRKVYTPCIQVFYRSFTHMHSRKLHVYIKPTSWSSVTVYSWIPSARSQRIINRRVLSTMIWLSITRTLSPDHFFFIILCHL